MLGSWLAHARSTPLQPDSGWVAVVLLWCRGIVFTRRHLLCFGTCRCSNLTQQLWVPWIGKTKAPLKGSSADLVLSQRISAFHTHCGLGINPVCWEILTIAGARESPSRSCVFMHGSKPARDGWAYLFGLTYLERVAYVNSTPLFPPPPPAITPVLPLTEAHSTHRCSVLVISLWWSVLEYQCAVACL